MAARGEISHREPLRRREGCYRETGKWDESLLPGSRVGTVVRARPGPGPGPGVIGGLSLLLVLYSAPRGFSPGTLVFLSPQKPTFLNSNSIRTSGT